MVILVISGRIWTARITHGWCCCCCFHCDLSLRWQKRSVILSKLGASISSHVESFCQIARIARQDVLTCCACWIITKMQTLSWRNFGPMTSLVENTNVMSCGQLWLWIVAVDQQQLQQQHRSGRSTSTNMMTINDSRWSSWNVKQEVLYNTIAKQEQLMMKLKLDYMSNASNRFSCAQWSICKLFGAALMDSCENCKD